MKKEFKKEFIHAFKGFGRVPSHCVVRIDSDTSDKEVFKHLILFMDINEGTSVTNASEQLATEIINRIGSEPENCRFFETYSQYNFDTFDEIVYKWKFNNDKWEASDPKWMPGDEDIKKILILIY